MMEPGSSRCEGRARPGGAAACLLALFLVAAIPGWTEDLEELLQRGGLEPARREEVRALFAEAASQGVPQGLLLPRLEEGLAKRVPAGRLVRVIERELGFLLAARGILQEEAGALAREEAAWARTANLLAGGLPAREVRSLVRTAARRPRDFRESTYLYVALLEWGLPSEEARVLLEALLDSALPGAEFAGVVELLAAGRSARIPPGRLVERIREALPQSRSLEDLEKRVLY
jgi:hypothetical protein